MAFASGETLTAARLNTLQPKTYSAQASASLVGPATSADITGATVTFTTLTNNAVYLCIAVFDMDPTGAATGLMTGFLDVDGVVFTAATYAAEVATDRSTVPQIFSGTLATAGSHTLKLKGTCAASQSIATTNTRLHVTIYEVV